MEAEIIPFGKYRGQPVAQLQNDPSYTEWLLAQNWFNERYSELRTVIINNFKEPDDSPEHNALQLKVLDLQVAFSIAVVSCGISRPFEEWARDNPSFSVWAANLVFEEKGWDAKVLFEAHDATTDKLWVAGAAIEFKPAVGEDFPSILRQVKSRKCLSGCSSIVVAEEFTASSVQWQSVVKMFSSSGIKLVLFRDIPLVQVPTDFQRKWGY